MTTEEGAVAEEPKTIIWPLGPMETYLTLANRKSCHIESLVLEIYSYDSIPTSVFKIALRQLQRDISTLRMTIKPHREGYNWVEKIDWDNQELPFTKIQSTDIYGLINHLKDRRFEKEPEHLWRVFYIQREENLHFPDSEILLNRNNTLSFLIFSMHPSIADSITMMNVCKHLIHLLNQTMSGKMSSIPTQVGIFIPENCARRFKRERYTFNTEDKPYLMALRRLENREGIMQYISPHKDRYFDTLTESHVPKSKFKTLCLSIEETEAIMESCLENSINIYSYITAILNASIISIIDWAKNSIKEEYLSSYHTIDQRKFYEIPGGINDSPELAEDIFGYHLTQYLFIVKTSMDYFINPIKFWEYAKQIHNSLYSVITTHDFYKQVDGRDHLKFDINTRDHYYKNPSHAFLLHYLGNIDDNFPQSDKIKISSMLRLTSGYISAATFNVGAFIYHGKLTINLDYSTNNVSKQKMRILLDSLKIIIQSHFGGTNNDKKSL